ncbi:Utp14-domain-containing protein [Saccharata proteae CBS 121410]|uniref:Utp14-domain-containing protein n=1 Tax=Saccharata proteae CBS 121410 TaxID=1314787 RepID=A0A6A5YET0_9PEZI|nr:Utp14-domain-containing protein [Saccharata proteae CBS 121410]
MPARVARSSVAIAKPHNARKKNQKRSLDAYAIAEKSQPSRLKVRQHRLGEAEDDNPRRKRQRLEDDDEDEDEPHSSNARRLQQKKVAKGRFDELDISEGSDSEGNNWQMGHVDEDDDEDLDSDEAFGESDEERFEGFTFRGSSGGQGKKKKSVAKAKARDQDGDMDLEEEEEEEEDDDDESLGSDAVDLAAMLDDVSESEEEAKPKQSKKDKSQEDEEELSDEESFGDSEEDEESEPSDFQMSDDEDADVDAGKISQLQDLISTISQEQDAKKRKDRPIDVHESATPSDFGVGASQKLDITDLLAGTNDPNAKKLIKMLKDDKPSKRKGIPGKLDAPLPKRQQDKLDRTAANEKAKETLERWVDTVKQNRRAEHISFPLKDPNAGPALGEKKLARVNNAVAQNDLEKTIQSIMEQSGLATGKEEDKIREYEELQTNKMPIEEVLARRAELRKARDLLFREEVRAKRIKKIKSKSYRRVHRKERERIEEREREAMAAAGIEISEDERERQDRRRAEERMGAKHRESKWAKGVKKSGRAAWDEDARDGVTEMARRNEELRQRIEGKDVRGSDDDGTDVSSEESEDDDDSDAEDGEQRKLRRQLERLNGPELEHSSAGKLAGLKFMQRADAARKAQNDDDIKRMQRELGGKASESDEENDNEDSLGRRVFGPTPTNKSAQPTKPKPVNEFEERPGSDAESDGEADEIKFNLGEEEVPARSQKQKSISNNQKRTPAPREPSEEAEDNAWLAPAKERGSKAKAPAAYVPAPAPPATESKTVSKAKPQNKKSTETSAPADTNGWKTVSYGTGEGAEAANDDSDHEAANPFILRKTDLVEKAFAGDEVADAFEAEKRAVEEDEGEKIIDNTLPGWGSWTGDGVSKREQKRNAGRFLTKQEGVKKDNRKDAKLKNVVINEKRVKKNAKFLASALPFPYENKQVYESTLRRPLGPEFNTKEVFQDGTKPRVMVKPGSIIKPMSKPLV